MNKILLPLTLVLFAGSLFFVDFSGKKVGTPVAGPVRTHPGSKKTLRTRIEVPPFRFLEARERVVSNKDLAGKVWTCAFIFTHCPTHCVEMAREMRQVQWAFAKEKDFRIVAVTVDPARDTPEQMRRFGKDWDADPKVWWFLTGKRSDIVEFAISGIKSGVDKEEPLNHSLVFALIDKQGFVRDYYHVRDVERMKQMRKDIRTLLAETPEQPSR